MTEKKEINTSLFSEAGKKGQQIIRRKLGEKKYRAMKVRASLKGVAARKKLRNSKKKK